MIIVSDLYTSLANAQGRLIDFKITTNDEESTVYGCADIISATISRAITDSGIQIGNCISDRFEFVANTTDKVKSGTLLKPYVRFKGETNSEWLQLGRFYAVESHVEDKLLYVTAYDRFYAYDKKCNWNGKASIELAPLTFPATMQQVIDYICAYRGTTHSITCQNFTISTKPDSAYTQRDIIGFIAGTHGGNAKFSNTGVLQLKQFTNQNKQIEVNDCFSQTIDSSDTFTVNGILFKVDDTTSVFIDDDNSEYDDEMEGCIVCENPFASIAVAEYAWNVLGGLTYSDCEITKRAIGVYEVGEVLQIKNHNEPDTAAVNIITNEIKYTINVTDGFNAKITSVAETSEQSSNRIVKKNDESGGGGLTITDSIILSQRQGDYYIGDYTVIDVINGEKSVYGNANSDIIVSGYVTHSDTDLNSLQQGDYYNITLNNIRYTLALETIPYQTNRAYFTVRSYDNEQNMLKLLNGAQVQITQINHARLALLYNSINAPNTTYATGYAKVSIYIVYYDANGVIARSYVVTNTTQAFSSIAEYYNAIKLTQYICNPLSDTEGSI